METGKSPNKKSIKRVIRREALKGLNQDNDDLLFWLSKTVKERAAPVTFLITQSLLPEQRLDKSYLIRKRL